MCLRGIGKPHRAAHPLSQVVFYTDYVPTSVEGLPVIFSPFDLADNYICHAVHTDMGYRDISNGGVSFFMWYLEICGICGVAFSTATILVIGYVQENTTAELVLTKLL